MARVGSGYAVFGGGGYNPVGSLGTPTPLALSDNSQVVAGTLGISVGSNGWIALGTGNSAVAAPVVTTLLGNPSTAFYSWHDLNPAIAGSGQVMYEQAGALAQVTYNGVWNAGGTSVAAANDIQFQIDTATGDVVIAWGATSATGNGWLVGYSPGGASVDPGGSDLSDIRAGLSVLLTGGNDIVPLGLIGATRPVLGTNWNLTVQDIPASTVLGVHVFGTADPMIPDLGSLGMPTCQLRSTLDVIIGPWLPAGTSFTYTFPLPAAPASLVGLDVFTQAATFGVPPVNPFGAITSNGIRGTVGDF
jgi:hypothetical protein